MAHLSLYRKWRPQSFDDVVGQEPVTRTLRSAIASGRVAHAYLFSGHRGTGKTTTARLLAKALNCEKGPTPDPCNACEACRAIADGYSMDVIELDAASNRGIDEIREIRERVRLAPAACRYKVYILDEAHMLTSEAENALLKTLEEPPPHVVFVLVTTEPHRLPATILSRCQRFEFRRIPTAQVVQRLERIAKQEGLRVSTAALHRIARAADGALRDAESVLDQLAASVDGPISEADVVQLLGLLEDEVVDALTEAVRTRDTAAALRVAAELVDSGRDVRAVLRRLLGHFRDLLVLRVARDPRGLVDAPEERYPLLTQQARAFTPEALLRALAVLSAAEGEARWSAQPRLALELALVRLAQPELDPGVEGLRARLERLEQRLLTPQPPHRPEPATPAAQPTSLGVEPPVSLEQATARWPRVLEEVKGRRAYTFALLAEGQPATVDNGRLVVRFPPGSEFVVRTLEDPRHRGLVEEAVREVLGAQLRLDFTAPDGPAPTPSSPRDPLVEQATHLLGPAVAFRPLGPEEPS